MRAREILRLGFELVDPATGSDAALGMKPNTGSGGYVCGRTAGREAVALD
jgi:hypothetical protein